MAQMQDEKIRKIKSILEKGEKDVDMKQYFIDYEIKKGMVYRKVEDGQRAWVVPKMARMQICHLCHDEAGHLGIEKTLERMKRNYWFPSMRRFVTKYVKACLNCAYYKNTAHIKLGRLHPIEKKDIPFDTIHIDHVGPFETSKRKKKFLFVVVDGFTKFCFIEPVRDQKSSAVVKILTELIYLFGAPRRIISDRGSAFTSQTFKTFCGAYNIKHILNAVATPRANGQCERYNKTIVNALATVSAGAPPEDWDLYVKPIQSTLNTTYNKGIGTTPMEALTGYCAVAPSEAKLVNAVRDELHRTDIKQLREKISKYITEDQRKQKARYDVARKEAKKYMKDDIVLVQITSDAATGSSRKLRPKYRGPFRITKVLLNDRYEVEDLRENTRKCVKIVAAAERLKPWTAAVH